MEEASWDKAGPAAFALFAALALVPTILFAMLGITGELRPSLALLSWALCTLVACGFALLLGRDVVVMTRLVRALRSAPEALPVEGRLFIPGMSELGAEALRLIHAERLLRQRGVANAAEDRALVERLPDPLM